MTHTPEPWGIVGDGTGRKIWAYALDEVNGQLIEPTYHVIAQTFGPDRVARPNAIVIASVPDLLAKIEEQRVEIRGLKSSLRRLETWAAAEEARQ